MPTPIPTPTLISLIEDSKPVSMKCNDIVLYFWIRKNHQLKLVHLMVKKQSDRRSLTNCECYPIITITNNGELYRNSGLPVDWGFRLTTELKIKEVH
jgi:hypothetical protein